MRESIISTALSQIGTFESPPNSNNQKYGVWYGMNGVPWCAIFVSWVYDQAGIPLGYIDSPKGYHYCPSAYNFWKRNNRITMNPEKGDIILFDWTGDGVCDHTGIFHRWITLGKVFESIEGNTSTTDDSNGGGVMLRQRSVSLVKAFVVPTVLDISAQINSTFPLQKGMVNGHVTDLQRNLYKLKYPITVDGDFGNETESEYKNFQRDYHLPQSGICSEHEFDFVKMIAETGIKPSVNQTTGAYLKNGSYGALVIEIQKRLNILGISPSLVEDGYFGSATEKNVKTFQKNKGMTVDGIVGPKTINKLGVNIE